MSTHEFVCAVCIGVYLFMAAVMAFYVIFARDRILLYSFIPILRISSCSCFRWRLLCIKRRHTVFWGEKFALLLSIQVWSTDNCDTLWQMHIKQRYTQCALNQGKTHTSTWEEQWLT